MELQPFFRIAGGKWRTAKRYPAPKYARIVEPFAGSAGYSLRHAERDVTLVDANEGICMAWDFLIRASERDILSIPVLSPGERLDDPQLMLSAEVQQWLGRVINIGNGEPRKQVTRWPLWNEKYRLRVAGQLQHIRHWKVIHGDYTKSPDVEATYFVDPPYVDKQMYRERVDSYDDLASWCRTRRGQTIVCEGKGAMWLPFEPHSVAKTHSNATQNVVEEWVWTSG